MPQNQPLKYLQHCFPNTIQFVSLFTNLSNRYLRY